MSTNATVGLRMANGRVRSTYVHSDGHPDGVGLTLLRYYQDPGRVKILLDHGLCSILAEKIKPDPTKPHRMFGQYQDDVCLFYLRDRYDGESKNDLAASLHPNVETWRKREMNDYNYLLVPGDGWYWAPSTLRAEDEPPLLPPMEKLTEKAVVRWLAQAARDRAKRDAARQRAEERAAAKAQREEERKRQTAAQRLARQVREREARLEANRRWMGAMAAAGSLPPDDYYGTP